MLLVGANNLVDGEGAVLGPVVYTPVCRPGTTRTGECGRRGGDQAGGSGAHRALRGSAGGGVMIVSSDDESVKASLEDDHRVLGESQLQAPCTGGLAVRPGDAERVADLLAHARNANTERAYRASWREWTKWCSGRGIEPLPPSPEALALFLTDEEARGRSVSTMELRLAAVGAAHRRARLRGEPWRSEPVRLTMRAIRRKRGSRQDQKAALRLGPLERLLRGIPPTLAGTRDRALLLLGWAGAFRRSELVGILVEHLRLTEEGVRVLLPVSKTDQEGKGHEVPIPFAGRPEVCPVTALSAWLEASEITAGPVFRGITQGGRVREPTVGPHGEVRGLDPGSVARTIKKHCARVGLIADDFAGHSLRAGFATEAAAQGIEERGIADQTRHKSLRILRRYIREGAAFRAHPLHTMLG